MATPIVLPKLGNTVESSIILQWHKAVGDFVEAGDILCEVETDKTTVEVESPVSGTLLAHFFAEGDDVPVMINIAAVGEAGEAFDDLRPQEATGAHNDAAPVANTSAQEVTAQPENGAAPLAVEAPQTTPDFLRISPRAKNLAQRKQIDFQNIIGTGPLGRIIERDIEQALRNQPTITPVARAMVDTGEYQAPERGTGVRGRITKADLIPAKAPSTSPASAADIADQVEAIPVRGVRKTIARRMLESLQTTAQLTLSASANAQGLLNLRKWLKSSPPAIGLGAITINDLIMYATMKTLLDFPEMNSIFENDTIYRHSNVHLGFAVDTDRGLLVPVIRNTNHLNLMQLSAEAHRLADACLNSTITPDELDGGTFTVSNLGNLGVEVFTPVLNPPQVGILGVGTITPRPVPTETGYDFAPHITLSLTINHQVVDGAPAARFLKRLSENLANINEV